MGFLGFRTGFEIGLSEYVVWDCRGRLVDRGGGLHAFDGAGFGVLTSFATELAFSCTLVDGICGKRCV